MSAELLTADVSEILGNIAVWTILVLASGASMQLLHHFTNRNSDQYQRHEKNKRRRFYE
ncbi:hypothetical protein KBD75_03710 [Candidatus Woesebacteria bacterium]|nr:hypothetical protein [Candidatus Woesebacteria bacterium]